MSRNKFSATRGILVIVLIGALYAVSKVVTPAPALPAPLHPTPAALPTSPPNGHDKGEPNVSESQMQERMKNEMQMAQRQAIKRELEIKANHGKPLPPEDTVNSDYFHHHSMGGSGLKETDEEAANRQRVDDEVQNEMAARGLNGPIKPAGGKGASKTTPIMPASK